MKIAFTALCFALSLAAGAAQAQAPAIDLQARIDRCMSDNAGAKKVTKDVVMAYCSCMSEKMGPDEKKSITKWEGDQKKARKECETRAGWM